MQTVAAPLFRKVGDEKRRARSTTTASPTLVNAIRADREIPRRCGRVRLGGVVTRITGTTVPLNVHICRPLARPGARVIADELE